jgi:hypothetical protein
MSIVVTRTELYDRVWAEPIQKLSSEFGLSGVGLAKLCRRYNIPVPPRGYWAKKQAGKRAQQPPLPAEGRKGYGDKVRLPDPSPRSAEPQVEPAPQHPLIAAEADPANTISVPENLQVRHPLLRFTREYWREVNRPHRDWSVDLPAHFNIGVGRHTQRRALRVLQALFTALERRGHQLGIGDRGQIRCTVLTETCDLVLRERQRRKRPEPTKVGAKPSPFPSATPYGLVHCGELELRVDRGYGSPVVRDKKDMPLEQQLNQVVVCLLKAAFAEKDARAARERERLAAAERERRQAIARQRAREERARVKHLDDLVTGATRHRQLLAFAAELRKAAGDVDSVSELGRWLAWVDDYAQSMDVLRRFRARQPSLTLYHCVSTHAAAGIVRHGFQNEGPAYGEDQEMPASVVLTDVPMEGAYGGTVCVLIDVPEETALPYERLQEGKRYRRFRMPAEVVNRFDRRFHEDS